MATKIMATVRTVTRIRTTATETGIETVTGIIPGIRIPVTVPSVQRTALIRSTLRIERTAIRTSMITRIIREETGKRTIRTGSSTEEISKCLSLLSLLSLRKRLSQI